ncbi:MAG: host attachment protein [Alcanivorax sp.]|nr:host attachment protein [Alcanivorax sp.]
MEKTWIVVSDSARARLLEGHDAKAPFNEIAALTHPASRQREHELASDKPGYAVDKHGYGRHAVNHGHSHEHESQLFAREIARFLHRGLAEHRFQRLFIAAPPGFLGILREQLNADTTKAIAGSVNKDLVEQDEAVIRASVLG